MDDETMFGENPQSTIMCDKIIFGENPQSTVKLLYKTNDNSKIVNIGIFVTEILKELEHTNKELYQLECRSQVDSYEYFSQRKGVELAKEIIERVAESIKRTVNSNVRRN